MTSSADPAGQASRFDWASERLLHVLRPHRARRMAPRERSVEAAAAMLFLVAAGGLALAAPSDRALSPGLAAALVVGYALASRVRLYVGTGYAMPTQLVLVPMLFWLPPAIVPLLVACALVAAALADAASGRGHPELALTGIASASYTVGAAAVFVLAGEPGPGDVGWEVVALALAAQFAVDLSTSAAREWLGRGISPFLQLRVIVAVYLVDVCLTPIAALAADRGAGAAIAIAAVVLLLAFLAGLAWDRRDRIEDLTARLDELEGERRRSDASIRRVAEAYGSGLDRQALVHLLLRTALDALRAERGRASAAGVSAEYGGGEARREMDAALSAAEAAARRDRRVAVAVEGRGFAVAQPLSVGARPAAKDDVVALARADVAFGDDEQALLGYLAAQMAVALENVALHERLGREARIDELTGLANHRHFQEGLRDELERGRRFRRSLGLAMVDIDFFKGVNDTYGHQQGDDVLRQVAAAIRGVCRATDLPARYGGEEMAVVMPETDLDGAFAAGEHLRRAIEELTIPRRDGGGRLPVTVSVGVAATGAESPAGTELIAAADAALYEAKRGGRNRTVRGGTPAVAGERARARFVRPPRN